MEQQRKIGGEGLRNRGILNEDRISELPEALLLHILSSLPSETVIATSVLSKRWKSLWKMVPKLKFDSAYHRTFSENVSRSLVLHKAPVLESLSLTVRYECDASEMGLWIGNAFARDVRKLVFKFKLGCQEDLEGPVTFPGVLCRCNNTLEILKLEGSILLDLPSLVCFNSLRVLNLYHVYFRGEESVSNLLCGCPSLQDLVIHRRYVYLYIFIKFLYMYIFFFCFFDSKTDGLGLSNRKAKKTKKGLSNRKAMNEDRISELPDALLLQILSSLPTNNAITTSVLSKRWRSVWKMVPILKFDSHQVLYNRDFRVFSDNVYRCLTLHKAPVLESLHLKFKGKIDCVDVEFEGRTDCVHVGIWIATAFARRVRKLVLVRAYQEEQIVTLPSVLFTYNDTLEILKLKYSIAIDFPSRVCLKSLKKLCLYEVRFQDEESVSNFLCGCPSLEDLDMYRYRESYTYVATFTIAVPSLQRLTLDDEYYGDGIGGYVINAPSLKYLSINGFHGFEFCLIENAPELLEAKIRNISDITDENILESLTSAKRLSLSSLSPSEIMPPTGKIFYQLLSLELSTKGKESWNLLSLMLSCSPKLQILKLFWFNSLYGDRNSPIDYKWNQPKCVPECLLFHLETFVWTRYDWQREDEKEVATYILKNARQLKKATLSTKDIEPKDLK